MRKAYLAFLTNIGWSFVKREQIMYCLSNGAYTQIYLAEGNSIMVSKNLKAVANLFEQDECFIRIHHSQSRCSTTIVRLLLWSSILRQLFIT